MLDDVEWMWLIAAGVGSLAVLGALSVASLFWTGSRRQEPPRGRQVSDARR